MAVISKRVTKFEKLFLFENRNFRDADGIFFGQHNPKHDWRYPFYSIMNQLRNIRLIT